MSRHLYRSSMQHPRVTVMIHVSNIMNIYIYIYTESHDSCHGRAAWCALALILTPRQSQLALVLLVDAFPSQQIATPSPHLLRPGQNLAGHVLWLPLLILLPLTLLQDFLQPLHDLERVWAWYILQCSTTHIAVHSHADFCKIDGVWSLNECENASDIMYMKFGDACIHLCNTYTHAHTHTSIFPHCGTTTCPINSSMVDHWCQCIRVNCILASYWNKAWEDASWGNMSGATRSHTQPSAYFQPAIDMLHGWHACYPTCTSASVDCIQAEMTLCNMSMWLINTKLRPPTVASQFSNLNFVTNREHYIVWRSHIYWEHLLFFFSAHERDVWEWTCAIRVTWQGSSHARPYPQKNANTATGVTKEMKAHNMGHAWSVMSCIQQV